MLTTQSVANYFIKQHCLNLLPALTPMKLQKMLFLSQSWNAVINDNFLIDDHFSMWKTGPVIPSLYHKTKYYKDSYIDKYITYFSHDGMSYYELVPLEEQNIFKILDKITQSYGHLSGSQLSTLITNHYPGIKENDCFDMNLLKIYPEKVIYQNKLFKDFSQEKTRKRRL